MLHKYLFFFKSLAFGPVLGRRKKAKPSASSSKIKAHSIKECISCTVGLDQNKISQNTLHIMWPVLLIFISSPSSLSSASALHPVRVHHAAFLLLTCFVLDFSRVYYSFCMEFSFPRALWGWDFLLFKPWSNLPPQNSPFKTLIQDCVLFDCLQMS